MKTVDSTTPLLNFDLSANEIKRLYSEEMQMHGSPRQAGLKPIDWVSSRLGPCSRTQTLEFRFRVWESDSWRVYVSNKKGICFEVSEFLTKEQALKCWSDFREKLGLPDLENAS